MQRRPIGLAIDRDGGDAQLVAGANDSNGYLAAVGDQDFVQSIKMRGTPNVVCHFVWYTFNGHQFAFRGMI
jgi:hypothetical protein